MNDNAKFPPPWVRSCFLLAVLMFPSAAVAGATSRCPAEVFAREAHVFDVLTICAKEDVPQEKLRHAANVAAAWLDNDLDGRVDEPELLPLLKDNHATLVMADGEFEEEDIRRVEEIMPSGAVLQDLYAGETDPFFGRDAAPEEIHHLIVGAGWVQLYPKLFGMERAEDSSIRRQWALAEDQGIYDYDDPTCDDDCKVMEFHSLAAAAYLGSDGDLHSDEMRLKSRQELLQKLPEVVRLFEAGRYHYPRHHWPDGSYPTQNGAVVLVK